MNKRIILFSFQIFFFIAIEAQVMDPKKTAPPLPPSSAGQNDVKFPEANAFLKSNVTYKIISAASNTYCYDIFSDGKLLIHQPSVPGVPGNKGFKNKISAEKVAALVVAKIKKGEMPPTVTNEEMKKIKAEY